MEKKIVVIDDEESLRLLLQEILSYNGYSVVSFGSAIDFLAGLKDGRINPKDIGLILTDYMMPGMNGKELCEEMIKMDEIKDVPVAFLTIVAPNESGISDPKSIGIVDYIRKPYNNEDLIQRIKKISEGR